MVRMSSAFRAALIALVALVALAACGPGNDWIVFRGEMGSGATTTRLNPPLGTKWKLRLQLDERTLKSFNPPIVKDDTIFFGSADGNFYALDIETGYMNWVFRTGGAINSVPFADHDNVYFGSRDGHAYAVDRRTGTEVWRHRAGRPVNSSFTRYEDKVIFASDGGNTFFISPEGELQFTVPNPIWHYNTFQVWEDVMYFAPGPMTQPHSFGAYDVMAREYLWVLDTAAMDATWYSFPGLSGDSLFMSTAQHRGNYWELNYYAYDRHTGQRLWRQTDTSRFGGYHIEDLRRHLWDNFELLDYMAPAIWRNTVIYTSGDTVVRAFDTRSGRPVWERQFTTPAVSAPKIAGDRVYFGLRGDPATGQSPRLIALSARDGRVLWDLDIEGTVLSAPVIAGKWIMFGTSRSFFYILEELY